jgi:ribosomal-protein-alanine N-acetyltransferase
MHVTLRPVRRSDGPVLAAANAAAAGFHAPWVRPFTDMAGFEAWFAQVEPGRRIPLLLELDGQPAGVFNLSEIVRGGFQNAYLGYYASPHAAGRGVMAEGLRLLLAHAFGPAGLHRVEANIQPGNTRSIALVRRAGFRLEGFTPRYLFIDGAWRDHERWARLADE